MERKISDFYLRLIAIWFLTFVNIEAYSSSCVHCDEYECKEHGVYGDPRLPSFSSLTKVAVAFPSTAPKPSDPSSTKNGLPLYVLQPQDVLIPAEQRNEYGPTAFVLSHTVGEWFEQENLFRERVSRLKTYFELPHNFTFLDEAEQLYLSSMIEAGTNLVKYAHPHLLIEKNPFYISAVQQFTYASFRYLHHRALGVENHLNIENAQILYHSSSFGDHRKKQEGEIKDFYQQPAVRLIGKELSYLAPMLKKQPQSPSEFLVDRNNEYEKAFTNFRPPPSLNDMLDALRVLRNFERYRRTTNTPHSFVTRDRVKLQKVIHNLSRIKNFIDIYNHLKIHDHLEHLTQAPLDFRSWSINQQKFWRTQPMGLLMGITKFIPYKYFEVDNSKLRESRRVLSSKFVAPEERIEALRYLHHQSVQWQKLRNLGLLVFHADKIKRPFHTDILGLSAAELIPELKAVTLPKLEAWMNFEIAASRGKVIGFSDSGEAPTPTLDLLSQYAADIAYTTKISEMASELKGVDILPTEATLRILNILGESAKNLSEPVKRLLGKDLWDNLVKMRNKIHHSRQYTRKMSRILEDNKELLKIILRDFRNIGLQGQEILKEMPITWEGVKKFYGSDFAPHKVKKAEGLIQLLELINPLLSSEDYSALRATKSSRAINFGDHLNALREALRCVEAARLVEMKDFDDHLNSLPLTGANKRKLKEFYKKLRIGGRKQYLIREGLSIVNKSIKKIHSGLSGSSLEVLKNLFEGKENTTGISENVCQEIVKDIYTEKSPQGKVLSAVTAIYHPDQCLEEENKERSALEAIFKDKKFELKQDDDWDEAVESLTRRLKDFVILKDRLTELEKTGKTEHIKEIEAENEKRLLSELDRLGIKNKESWRTVRHKIFSSFSKKPPMISQKREKEITPLQHVQAVLEDSMSAVEHIMRHLEKLDVLTSSPKGHLGRIDLDSFCKTPATYLSGEHHVEMIRQYIDVIEEGIQYLVRYDIWSPYAKVLNNFYRVLSLKLRFTRLSGNYFAHLHDISEYETRTPYGVRLGLWSQIITSIDGFPYGGREGRPVSYLPSLRKELSQYADLLAPFYDKAMDDLSFASSKPSSGRIASLDVYKAKYKGGLVEFEEKSIPGDGNCGFTGLELMRSTSIRQLIQNLADPTVAEMVSDDVREAFRGGELPPSLMFQVQHLADEIHEKEELIGGMLSTLNTRYQDKFRRRLTLGEMIEALNSVEDKDAPVNSNLLKTSGDQLENLQQQVWDTLGTQDNLAEFLREEFLQSGRYLSYVRGNRGTLYALAYINNLEVHIWTRSRPGYLVESFSVPAREHGASIIHLHHTAYGSQLNHFNLLTIKERDDILDILQDDIFYVLVG